MIEMLITSYVPIPMTGISYNPLLSRLVGANFESATAKNAFEFKLKKNESNILRGYREKDTY